MVHLLSLALHAVCYDAFAPPLPLPMPPAAKPQHISIEWKVYQNGSFQKLSAEELAAMGNLVVFCLCTPHTLYPKIRIGVSNTRKKPITGTHSKTSPCRSASCSLVRSSAGQAVSYARWRALRPFLLPFGARLPLLVGSPESFVSSERRCCKVPTVPQG